MTVFEALLICLLVKISVLVSLAVILVMLLLIIYGASNQHPPQAVIRQLGNQARQKTTAKCNEAVQKIEEQIQRFNQNHKIGG